MFLHAAATLAYLQIWQQLRIMVDKSVLWRVRNSCMLILRLRFVIVASQHVVDTRQMLYKY